MYATFFAQNDKSNNDSDFVMEENVINFCKENMS